MTLETKLREVRELEPASKRSRCHTRNAADERGILDTWSRRHSLSSSRHATLSVTAHCVGGKAHNPWSASESFSWSVAQ